MTTPLPQTARTNDRDLSGRQLGDYRLLRRLGRGAMAEVYLAEQASLERQVAFKVLKPDLATDQTYVKRFHMEARAAASLVHPAIVQIYEVGCIDGVHFIAQEYVQGQNLSERLARQGPPDLATAVRIMRQVAAALAKSAEQGIVHRDIKPENLMLSKTGEVKVADFGLARVTQNSDNVRLTQIGITMGSPLYMSPEQVEGRPLDPRSDIYSLGVTCYQMLAGRPPFVGESALSVAVQHLKSEPERLENLRPDLPPALCRIVHKMLAKDPGGRYVNGAEVLRDLRTLDIAGLETSWPEELDQWNTAEIVALSTARSAATQQLAVAMATGEVPVPVTKLKMFWIALVVAFACGAALAWPSGKSSLLADANKSGGEVPRKSTAAQQFAYAENLNTVEGWQRVIDYYPNSEDYVRRAKKKLADAYLDLDRFDVAMPLFEEFARLSGEPEYRAYGLAGQYVILSAQKQGQPAAERLTELLPLTAKLDAFDARMARLVRELLQKSRQHTKAQDAREVDQWIQRHVAEDAPPGNSATQDEWPNSKSQ